MRIGFVILTWNSRPYLATCLESVLALEKAEVRVIVSDNGSADGSLEVLREFAAREPVRLRLVENGRNLGTTVPRNRAISTLLAEGVDAVCVLDSDTVVDDAAIARLAGYLAAHPECGIVGPRLVSPDGSVQLSARNFPTLADKLLKALRCERLAERMERGDSPESGDCDYLISACWLVKPVVFEHAGLLDEGIFYAPEDAEFCLRVWKAGFRVVYLADAVVRHVWQRIGRRRVLSRHNLEHVRGLIRMFVRHRYLFSRKGLRP